jgi:SAM-dependent methyltransferase
LSLYDCRQLAGEFDLINCVGVLHHLPDPIRGIQSLAAKLAPGGLMHIFVYAELGRWEIQLMQKAIALLQGNQRGDYHDGVQLGVNCFLLYQKQSSCQARERTLVFGKSAGCQLC